MTYYIDVEYIFLEKHYRKWDPHMCHWGISNIILFLCVYGPHGDLITWMYKHFHDSLMRYLLGVNLYGVFMYFHDIFFVLMMFGRVKDQKWDPGIYVFHITWTSSSIVGLRQLTNLQLFEFILVEKWSYFLCGVTFEKCIQFSHAWCSWNLIIDISQHPCIRIIWYPRIIFGLIGFNFGGSKQHWRFIHHLIR